MMPHHPTTNRLCLLLLLCAAVAGLSSCKLMRKNYTVVADRVSPAQADDVVVERSSALPPIAPATAPGAPAAPAAGGSHGGGVVIVQPGDTLSRIAARHGVSTAALIRANGMTPQQADHIRAGQKLSLPGSASPAAARPTPQHSAPAPTRAGRSYTVKPGDTISRIAARHGVSTAALLRANGMTTQQADRIRAGQKLHIPAK